MNVWVFSTLQTVALLLKGVALKFLWGWFLAPLGLPGIGWFHALGLVVSVEMLTHRYRKSGGDAEQWSACVDEILTPLVAVILGGFWSWLI